MNQLWSLITRVIEESSGNDPQSVFHRSHYLAGRSRRLQGLLSIMCSSPVTIRFSPRYQRGAFPIKLDEHLCGLGRVRSYNPRINSAMLYLLSYQSFWWERRDSNPQGFRDRFTVCWANQLLNSPLFIFYKVNTFFLITKFFCPPGRLRSDSPHIKSMVLSQLSYEGFCLSYLSLSIRH